VLANSDLFAKNVYRLKNLYEPIRVMDVAPPKSGVY
jgi:hypothetical protein